MRVPLAISLLFLAIIAPTVESVDLTECWKDIDQTVSTFKPKQYYGSLNPFYSINKGIADGLQKQMNDGTLQDIYNLIAGTSGNKPSVGKVVNDVLKQQAGAIAFFCGGLAIILGAVVLGIVICSCRCCCNSCGADKTNSHPSNVIGVFAMIFALVAVFGFVLTGIIIFNLSASNLYSAIDQSPKWIDKVVTEINNNVLMGTGEMTCTVDKSMNTTFDSLIVQLNNYPTALANTLMNQTGLLNLDNFDFNTLDSSITTAGNQANGVLTDLQGNAACDDNTKQSIIQALNVLTSSLQTVQTAVGQVNSTEQQAIDSVNTAVDSPQIQQQLADAISQMTSVQSQISGQLNQLTYQVNSSMQIVRNVQNAIDSAQKDIVTWSGYSAVKGGWQALMSIPNCFCLLLCLLSILGLVYWFVSGKEGGPLGYAAVIGFYATIFLTVVAMGVTSAAFVFGWAISGACKPMFEDSTFKILGLANNIQNITITGYNYNSTVTVQQLMQRCELNQTVFQAVDGSKLISVDDINNMLNLQPILNQLDAVIGSTDISYQFDTSDLQSLTDALDALNTAIDTLNKLSTSPCMVGQTSTDFNSLLATLTTIQVSLNTLVGLTTDVVDNAANNQLNTTAVDFTNVQFNIASANVNASVADMINGLNSNAFPCYGLYQSYENAGVIMCDWFGRPVHGMWGAAGLAAIFFIPAAVIMLCASNVIFSGYRQKKISTMGRQEEEDDGPRVPMSEVPRAQAWEDNDVFNKPQISTGHYTQPHSYLPPTSEQAAPWTSQPTGLRRQDEDVPSTRGLRREEELYPRSGLRRLGDDGGATNSGWGDRWDEDSDDGKRDPYDIYNPDVGRSTGKGLTRM